MKQFFFIIICCAFSLGAYATDPHMTDPHGTEVHDPGPWNVGYPNPTDVVASFDGDHTLTFTGTGAIQNFIINYRNPRTGGYAPWVSKIYLDEEKLLEIQTEKNRVGETEWGYYDEYDDIAVDWYDNNGVLQTYVDSKGEVQPHKIAPFITGWEINDIASQITTVVISEGITKIGDATAWGLDNLAELVFPANNTVDTIASRAFCGHKILSEQRDVQDPRKAAQGTDWLVIPEGVKVIQKYAFSIAGTVATTRLLELPSTIVDLGDESFEGSKYRGFDSYAITPPTTTANTFKNWGKTNPVKVVAGCKQDYSTATNWSTFTNYFETLTARPTSIDTPKATDRAVKAIAGGVEFSKIGNAVVYNIAGQKLFEGSVIPGKFIPLAKGIYIVKVGSTAVKTLVNN